MSETAIRNRANQNVPLSRAFRAAATKQEGRGDGIYAWSLLAVAMLQLLSQHELCCMACTPFSEPASARAHASSAARCGWRPQLWPLLHLKPTIMLYMCKMHLITNAIVSGSCCRAARTTSCLCDLVSGCITTSLLPRKEPPARTQQLPCQPCGPSAMPTKS